ncbi:HipA domain-containing protein [Flavobacterium foetidum]|uniref:hypothetical protein n=1 Tax=Flavobacterium foetidum TaxID=2026681 RepID=UPI001074C22B|nr:hypothetical protein [Flavobacterium foetidum]KAF2516158.1 hypothetical protein E0W73_07845 [Flavobacterium foetidum]
MNQFEATFTDISEWHKNVHYSTGGTRSKYIALEPTTNDEYFFKGSKETIEGEIRYPTEFWSEIVSSKIGQFLGFPMLDYNIAFDENHKQRIGCISKSMILNSNDKLTEGKTYLTGFRPHYDPDQHKKDYTFQFICDALKDFSLDHFIKNIIEIIVFDSIIGNSDRHQENWGVLSTYELDEDLVKEEISSVFDKIKNKIKKLSNSNLKEETKVHVKMNSDYVTYTYNYHFAPIYDSGCCLGREHTDQRVLKMLNDKQMLEAYVKKGESEIHWNGNLKKKKHLELIELLINENPKTKKYIKRVKERYNSELIKEIIDNIDKNIPINLINFKLSDERKQLMFKVITLRIENLIKLL